MAHHKKHWWKGEIEQEVNDDFTVFVLKLLPEVSTLPSLVIIIIVKVEKQILQIAMELMFVTWSRGHAALRVGAFHSKSPIYQVWCR